MKPGKTEFTESKPEVQEKVEKVEKKEETQRLTVMSNIDAYITERMKSQPSSLDELNVEVIEKKDGVHRLSLPEYFEQFSHNCTTNETCRVHRWGKKRIYYGLDRKKDFIDHWEQGFHGKYVFRWLNKKERAIENALNLRGWTLVNQNLFPDAPRIHFSVNGGVENGDSVLAIMPVSRAIQIREEPSKISQFRIESEEKKYEGHPNFYKADLSPDKDGEDFAPPDAIQEGRDFNKET